jgi:hypothetical protein
VHIHTYTTAASLFDSNAHLQTKSNRAIASHLCMLLCWLLHCWLPYCVSAHLSPVSVQPHSKRSWFLIPTCVLSCCAALRDDLRTFPGERTAVLPMSRIAKQIRVSIHHRVDWLYCTLSCNLCRTRTSGVHLSAQVSYSMLA